MGDVSKSHGEHIEGVRGVTPQSTTSMKALTSLAAAAAFAVPLVISVPANAGADYCHTTTDGAYVCIQSVFGPRNNRGMVYTVDGYVYSSRFNCYSYNYGSTSLRAVACWSYTGIKSEPENVPEITEVPESVKGIMTEGGFISEEKAIDLEKVKNAMPPEMK